MVFPSPVRVQLRDPALRLVEVKCEYFRKLGNGKRSIRYGETLKHSIRVRLVRPLDFHHHPLVRPRPGIPEVHSESAARFAEDIVAEFRADRTPIET
jgi:hypothetical protein